MKKKGQNKADTAPSGVGRSGPLSTDGGILPNNALSFTFPGEPVPAERMNKDNIWADRVQNYLAYKRAFSTALEAAFPDQVNKGPHTAFKRERAKWLKEHKDVYYLLDIVFYQKVRTRADGDNLEKGVWDSLQGAGLLINDRRITDWSGKRRVDPLNPRVELVLTEYRE